VAPLPFPLPGQSTLYTLTVSNATGTSTCHVIVTIVVGCASVINQLRYQELYDRWLPADYSALASQVNDMLYEADTGNLLFVEYDGANLLFSFADQDGDAGTSDNWTTDGTDGREISASFETGFYYLDTPAIDKLAQDIILELDNPVPVTVNVFYDYSDTPDPNDTFTLPAQAGRHHVSLLSQFRSGISQGKEFFAVAFQFCWSGVHRVTFYELTFHSEMLGEAQSGRINVWNTAGGEWDKKYTKSSSNTPTTDSRI